MIITEICEHIKIEGYSGTWHIIDKGDFVLTPDTNDGRPLTISARLFLLGHETHGDEIACLIVDENGAVLLEDVYNGFEDLEEAGWESVD